MKRILVITIMVLVCGVSRSQLNTTLVMSANPPATLIDWPLKKEIMTYLIVNQGQPRQVIIKAELQTTDGTLAATTNLAKAKVLTLERGSSLALTSADVLPLEQMIFNGRFKSTLDKTGKLPAGSYQLCVQLVTPVDFLPVSEQRCRVFTIAAFQLPIPVMPAHESVLELDKSKTTITFRWTPVSPRPAETIVYRVTVFEILENQTPMQALRSNQPLLAKDVTGTTQYIWQHQFALEPCCKDGEKISGTDTTGNILNGVNAYGFIWTIQTFDQQGRPFGDGNINGDGISEPSFFLIDRRPAAMRQKAGSPKILFRNNMN